MVGSALHAQPWQDPSTRTHYQHPNGGDAMEFDEVYGELLPARDAAFELDRIELGTQPALHLFHRDD